MKSLFFFAFFLSPLFLSPHAEAAYEKENRHDRQKNRCHEKINPLKKKVSFSVDDEKIVREEIKYAYVCKHEVNVFGLWRNHIFYGVAAAEKRDKKYTFTDMVTDHGDTRVKTYSVFRSCPRSLTLKDFLPKSKKRFKKEGHFRAP